VLFSPDVFILLTCLSTLGTDYPAT